jgi:hypothetical protein
MAYIKELIANCEQALLTKPQRSFLLEDLADLDDIKTAIYIIELTSGDAEKVFQDFLAYRQRRERACAKLNSPSRTLYVGSSTTGLKARIRQHIGDGHKGTSALHLKEWCNEPYQVRVLVYRSVPRPVLQIVEDSMAYELKPAFGKSGPNNK